MPPATVRFAPSPNGRLHLGHAFSALLNAQVAAETGGRFLLRIEDIDGPRCPRHLAEAAMADLAWLGLTWETPVRYQSEFTDFYAEVQSQLEAMGLLYPCFCSRQDIAMAASGPRDPDGQPLYPGTCKHRPRRSGIPFALRLDMERALRRLNRPLTWDEHDEGEVAAAPEAWGDLILVRKDIGTSYHIAVVADDALQGITDVIRGRDLYHAASVHRLLQALLGYPVPRYRHHRLIEAAGRKLSKSAGDTSLAALRTAGITPQDIRDLLGFAPVKAPG
jgi:glutamyl-Q tRNA(Asp) synthetase